MYGRIVDISPKAVRLTALSRPIGQDELGDVDPGGRRDMPAQVAWTTGTPGKDLMIGVTFDETVEQAQIQAVSNGLYVKQADEGPPKSKRRVGCAGVCIPGHCLARLA